MKKSAKASADILAWNERTYPEPVRANDIRRPSEHDPDRIIYSAAFRRLQAKTQVVSIGEGDFHRTRLTHSLEVSQLGLGILRMIVRSEGFPYSLKKMLPTHWNVTAMCLGHDLGHPAFGHGGEVALNYCMKGWGGFEGNAQTMRILTRLEQYQGKAGLNLTRRSLLGLLKYPAKYSAVAAQMHLTDLRSKSLQRASDYVLYDIYKPPKCYYDSDNEAMEWILKPFSPSDRRRLASVSPAGPGKVAKPKGRSLDSSLMELADDLAYGVHDLEDAISLGLVTKEVMAIDYESTWARKHGLHSSEGQFLDDLFPTPKDRWKRREAVARVINALITSVDVAEDKDYESPLLRNRIRLSSPARRLLDSLQAVVLKYVVNSEPVRMADFKGMKIVTELFHAIMSNPERLLKDSYVTEYRGATTDAGRMRVICDFISGMSDEYAARYYERLFLPHEGSVFEKL